MTFKWVIHKIESNKVRGRDLQCRPRIKNIEGNKRGNTITKESVGIRTMCTKIVDKVTENTVTIVENSKDSDEDNWFEREQIPSTKG